MSAMKKRGRVNRFDPWTEVIFTVRGILRHPEFSRNAAQLVVERCMYCSAEGDKRAYAHALNAVKSLVTHWRDVPASVRQPYEIALTNLLNALEAWPAHLKASFDELEDVRKTRAERAARLAQRPTATPYYLRD